ncbi:MAG: hypothetical protein QOG67_2964 [Verrucomicrobiota bacterium]
MNPTSSQSSELKFEIGHVLFIDIVGYSKLLINEQSEQIQKLKDIVRGTEQVRVAEAEGKLLRLPTGDGGALERAYREGTGAYLFVIKVDPFLDDLRGDPRFEALVEKIVGQKK